MQAKPKSGQAELFKIPLAKIINTKHPLCILGAKINWSEFDKAFGPLYSEGKGRPAKPTRLMVGLHYLKHTYNLSDEEVVAQWLENPYWQHFCGNEYFEHGFPIDASSMTRWRKRVSVAGMEKLLEETVSTGLDIGALKKASINKLNVDTTVQEKAISFPTDAKLYHRMREKLVSTAVQQMDQLTQQNAASAEETAAASEELSAQAQNLMEQVNILAAQVGGAGEGAVVTRQDDSTGRQNDAYYEEPTIQQVHSGQTGRKASPVKRLKSVRKTRLDTDGGNGGNVIEDALHKKDLDRVIPMGEETVVEHDETSRDF